jgi:ribonuclease HI
MNNIDNNDNLCIDRSKVYDVYVDGSYNRHKKIGSYAFVVIDRNKSVIYSECAAVTNIRLLAGHQVGCECKAVVQALKWSIQHDVVIDLYYDLVNLKNWIDDLWGNKPWSVNTEYSKAYREYCLSNRRHIRRMIKVKSHSGNLFNEMVDGMCQSCYVGRGDTT